MVQQHVGEFLEGLQPLPLQLIHPLLQVVEHGPFVVVIPQPLQAFFQQTGFEDPPVHLEQPVQVSARCAGQVFPSTHQQPLLALDHFALLFPLAEEFRLPHLVDRIVGVLDDVELVIHDLAVRRPFLDAQTERLPHVHARRLNPLPLPAIQLAPKEFIQCLFLALPAKPQRLRCLQIAHNGEKLALLASVQLIHAHLS